MLKFEQLRYFQATAETGSFAAAGKKIHLSASAIAHGINALESHLGVVLLARKPASGVTVTPEGRQFLKQCQTAISEVESLESNFRSSDKLLQGELVVGCQEALTWSVAPRAIEILSQRHPDLHISLKTIFMDQRYQPLEDGDVDILLTFLVDETPPSCYTSMTLCNPNTYALMSANHPVYREGERIQLETLVNYPQIFIQDGPAMGLFAGMYKEAGLEPKSAVGSNISSGAQAVVGKTDAICLRIVRPSIHFSPLGDEIGYMEIQNEVKRPKVSIMTHKATHNDTPRKRMVFMEACKELFDSGAMRENFFY